MVDFITKYIILDNLLQTTKIASFLTTNSNFVVITEKTSVKKLTRLFRNNV